MTNEDATFDHTTTIDNYNEAIHVIFQLHKEETGKTKMNVGELIDYSEQLGLTEMDVCLIEETWAHIYTPGYF